MDSMIINGQKNTLVEYMILSGADNHPPMLDKDLYDSWKSRMQLYMQNKEHGRMIIESVEHGPLIWPTIEENRVTRTKKYVELVAKDLWETIQLLMQVLVFKQGDNPIDAINKMMSFLSTVIKSHFPSTNNQLRNSSNPRQQATIHDGRVTVQPLQGRQKYYAAGKGKVLNEEELEFLEDPGIAEAKEVLMANLSSYGSDVLSEDTNSSSQQVDMILSVFEQLSYQVTNGNKVIEENLIANETLSAELERYKERVKLLEERQNVDLGTREKLIIDDINQDKDAQFTDFEKEINSLKQTLSEQLKEKELLTKTFSVFKNESKENKAKNIDNEITLGKKVKELDNIVHKMVQSTQTVHMLTKPQVFYDNNLKQALGFQNSFYLNKAQQIRPMLYDGSVIAKETNIILITDSEEALMLEEESRSKMLLKQCDPIVLEKKVNIKPINYAELNRLSQDFGKSICHNSIKNDLRKLNRKEITDNAAQMSNAAIIAPGMYKLNSLILVPKVKNDREAHEYYLKHIMEQDSIDVSLCRDSLACLKLSLGSSIYIVVWNSIRYGVLELNTAYRGCLAWALRIKYSRIFLSWYGYGISELLDTAYRAPPVRRIELLGYEVLAKSVLFLIIDQSIIYDVYTDVDTAYSSKLGNCLEFFKVFRYGVCF
uniref:Integrase, catalytic region, zinc finger, CCHC-type, peptidase aspartic, catalytic n=1 Tax=Tanacetum cinerariifolium TaxID=118510 RepID=A0A699GL23_TANCI|nr:hypothetical protein [Tanacetum cinerariifolium]